MPGVQRKQPPEFQKEIGRAFYGFYLDVGISPKAPRLIHVLLFRPPFNVDFE